MEIKGTQTEKNLQSAYAGESQASNNYSIFANKARSEGYEAIAQYFELTSRHEKAHALIWHQLLNDGLNSTLQNLNESIKNEHFECTSMYKEFAETARNEGLDMIANLFEKVAVVEREHELEFLSYISSILNNEKEPAAHEHSYKWICGICGYIENGDVPDACPLCGAVSLT